MDYRLRFPPRRGKGTVGMNRYSRDTTAEASKLEIGMRTHPLPLQLYWASEQYNARESFVADRWLFQLYPYTRTSDVYTFKLDEASFTIKQCKFSISISSRKIPLIIPCEWMKSVFIFRPLNSSRTRTIRIIIFSVV